MGIKLVVDANIIISALIGGATREIFFDKRFDFVTTEYTVSEVEKYFLEVAEKAEVSETYVKKTFDLLPLEVRDKEFYKGKLEEARDQIQDIDSKDVDILALALKTGNYLWTDDKDFDKIDFEKIIKTKDFF